MGLQIKQKGATPGLLVELAEQVLGFCLSHA